MLLKIKETTEKEIEVKFPLFGKFTGETVIKVISPDSYITVELSKWTKKIESLTGLPESTKGMLSVIILNPITEAEFNQAFSEALKQINSLIPELSAPTLERNEPSY